MPLLRNGHLTDDDSWVFLDDDSELPSGADQALLTSLDRFVHLMETGEHAVAGVRLNPEDDVLRLGPHLHRIQLIVIDFPVYTDGRGYSQARMLRDHFGYAGELRASGDVRPDQLLFMVRAGMDTFEFDSLPNEQLVQQLLSRYRVNYQPSYALPVAG